MDRINRIYMMKKAKSVMPLPSFFLLILLILPNVSLLL